MLPDRKEIKKKIKINWNTFVSSFPHLVLETIPRTLHMIIMYSLIKQNQVFPDTSNLKYQDLISVKLFSKKALDEIQCKFMIKALSKLVRWEFPQFDKEHLQQT